MPIKHLMRNRLAGAPLLLAALMLVQGCADREGAIGAAERLADAVYPGELETIGTQLQKSYYDVIFAVKGDPFTRIRLQMDPDPAACHVGTACEKRLRRAYIEGRARGEQLKTMNTAFRECGVPLLATFPVNGGIAYAVELDLGVENQQPALDRLAHCTDAFAKVFGEPIRHNFLIFRPNASSLVPASEPVTPDTKLPRDRRAEAGYWISVNPDREYVSQTDLRIDAEFLRSGPAHDKLVEEGRAFLKKHRPDAVLPWPNSFWKTRLDPTRVDRVRTYLMACSEKREGRCRQDLGIRMTYDISAGVLTEISLMEAPQGVNGLPDLPGRGQ